ncbi:Histone H2A/H2B/H3 [Trinorchestia longiramus]|nr:Histone H2A/H2B/H3 [Trinorchestia longiramus]
MFIIYFYITRSHLKSPVASSRPLPSVAAVSKRHSSSSNTQAESPQTGQRESPVVQKTPLHGKKHKSGKSILETTKSRKKYRFRPGTLALKEIRRFQKTTDMLIPKASFGRVVGEIMSELGCGHFR